jgi:hypothetical protein
VYGKHGTCLAYPNGYTGHRLEILCEFDPWHKKTKNKKFNLLKTEMGAKNEGF